MRNFLSDHTGSICDPVFEAMAQSNVGQAAGFGNDQWSLRLNDVLGELFDRELEAFPVVTGSAANSLALATLSPPYGVIFCHEQAHVESQEGGAPEFFTGGAKLALVPGENGKIDPGALRSKIGSFAFGVHSMKPSVLSLTQATELGTVYTIDELKALCTIAHDAGLSVHMDGARLANAVVKLGCSWADTTWRAGIDVLSFSSTKNGTMCGEAVIFFDEEHQSDFEIRRKRGGHFISKLRYFSSQILGYVESGVWKVNAQRSNALAGQIATAAADLLIAPVETNQIFMSVPGKLNAALIERDIKYIPFAMQGQPMGRFVVSWDQPEEDIAAFLEALSVLQSQVRA